MRESQKYYDVVIAEVKNSLPNENFIHHMEKFYKKEFDEYLRSLPVSTKEFLYQMKQLNINVTTNKKRMNAGWQDFNKSATYAYMIDMSTLPKDMKDGVKKAEAA